MIHRRQKPARPAGLAEWVSRPGRSYANSNARNNGGIKDTMEKNLNDTEDVQEWKVIEEAFREGGEVDRYQRMIMQYQCAMLEVKTKLDVLNAELSLQNRRNPFETIKCRIKSPRSIREKLERNRLAMTIENAEKNLNDIAGIRVICSFPDDIYMLSLIHI